MFACPLEADIHIGYDESGAELTTSTIFPKKTKPPWVA